jgi:hypothetical protein
MLQLTNNLKHINETQLANGFVRLEFIEPPVDLSIKKVSVCARARSHTLARTADRR